MVEDAILKELSKISEVVKVCKSWPYWSQKRKKDYCPFKNGPLSASCNICYTAFPSTRSCPCRAYSKREILSVMKKIVAFAEEIKPPSK